MKNFILALALVLSGSVFSSNAHALIDIDVVANGSLIKTARSPDAFLGIGAGALVGFDMFTDGAIETGLIWENRKAGTDLGSLGKAEASFKYLQIPVTLKYSILPMLSLRGGLYYAKAMGDIESEVTVAGVSASGSTTYAAANVSDSDFGAIAGVGFKLPMGLIHGVANANYLFGLKDVDTSGGSAKFKGFEFQVGVGMGI